MADEQLSERVPIAPEPSNGRVAARAATLDTKKPYVTPAEVDQANALLAESDARGVDPAVLDLDDDRVERRTSDEATEPAED